MVRDLAGAGSPVILVADYPSIGLIPLLEHARGVILLRGSLLCHTAIVLRERGIPAVVAPGAHGLRTGERVQLSRGRVERLP